MKKLFTSFITFLVFYSGYSQEISVEIFAFQMMFTTDITHAGDDRIFIARKDGIVRVYESDGSILNHSFLDITSIVNDMGEMGLLGLAFPPDYSDSGKFYVHYNNLEGDSVIARYSVSDNPNQANPDGTILMTIENFAENHKGGTIRFGPDGYLWISVGDDANWENGQNIHNLKGKILRIDVSGEAYTIPPDNPFVGVEGEDEIWAYGLRNPWKFSFDYVTGNIWIGDVGSNLFEEINRSHFTESGLNYGWNCYEGNYEYPDSGCDGTEEVTFPYAFYEYGNGKCSIIGGIVYRGSEFPNLFGKYIFADLCMAEIGWLDEELNMVFTSTGLSSIFTIGEDFYGNLYIGSSDRVYKIIDESMGINDQSQNTFSIYPNPTTDYINIISYQTIDEVSIYSADGKLIQKLNGNATQIDISSYPKGIYLVTVRSGNVSKTQKVVKK